MQRRHLFISVLIFLSLPGLAGSLHAEDGAPGVSAAKPGIVTRLESRYRIFRLKDRMEGQRERIAAGQRKGSLSGEQARTARDIVDSVADAIASEAKAHGAGSILSKERYGAFNASLDANAKALNEERQFYYSYGPDSDVGDNYRYYYDPFADPAAPSPPLTVLEMKHPRIFELKERIKSQRGRIDQGVKDGTLSADEAKARRAVLTSVEAKINVDYRSKGTKVMTRGQFDSYNTELDENSAVLHEEKSTYYYYSPYYDRFSYWD